MMQSLTYDQMYMIVTLFALMYLGMGIGFWLVWPELKRQAEESEREKENA